MVNFSEYFKNNEEAMIADISRLVAIESVRGEAAPGAPYGPGPRAALEEAYKLALEKGFSAEIRGDRVLCIEYGEGDLKLGILAHLDCVPAGDGWQQTTPFAVKREGDLIFGRGVADDKGPAVAALYALCAVRDSGIRLGGRVQLLLGSDEECGSSDMAWYKEHYELPPMVFTPDGEFPVVNVEKGHLNVRFVAPFEDAAEPSVVSVKGGTVANAVPAYCEAVVKFVSEDVLFDAERYLSFLDVSFDYAPIDDIHTAISCRGTAAHAAMPEKGSNAICGMLRYLMALPVKMGPLEKLANALPYGDIYGETVGAACEDFSGKLTVNLGLISYDAEGGLSATIDSRVPVCTTGEAVYRAYADAVAPMEAICGRASEPHCVPGDGEFVTGLMEIYRAVTGLEGEPIAIGGGTYVHDIPGGVAFGCEFPGSITKMHEPDEQMSVRELQLSGQMFAEAVIRFVK